MEGSKGKRKTSSTAGPLRAAGALARVGKVRRGFNGIWDLKHNSSAAASAPACVEVAVIGGAKGHDKYCNAC